MAEDKGRRISFKLIFITGKALRTNIFQRPLDEHSSLFSHELLSTLGTKPPSCSRVPYSGSATRHPVSPCNLPPSRE